MGFEDFSLPGIVTITALAGRRRRFVDGMVR
jgi:hypothetical protein